jgi:hypothetical protein
MGLFMLVILPELRTRMDVEGYSHFLFLVRAVTILLSGKTGERQGISVRIVVTTEIRTEDITNTSKDSYRLNHFTRFSYSKFHLTVIFPRTVSSQQVFLPESCTHLYYTQFQFHGISVYLHSYDSDARRWESVLQEPTDNDYEWMDRKAQVTLLVVRVTWRVRNGMLYLALTVKGNMRVPTLEAKPQMVMWISSK